MSSRNDLLESVLSELALSLYEPVGTHTTNSTLSSAVNLTSPTGARGLILQAFTQNIRVTLDGSTTPTSTVGFQVKPDDGRVLLSVPEGETVKVIEETASASIQYQWVG